MREDDVLAHPICRRRIGVYPLRDLWAYFVMEYSVEPTLLPRIFPKKKCTFVVQYEFENL